MCYTVPHVDCVLHLYYFYEVQCNHMCYTVPHRNNINHNPHVLHCTMRYSVITCGLYYFYVYTVPHVDYGLYYFYEVQCNTCGLWFILFL